MPVVNPNPYAVATQVDPKREQDELVKLRNDPQKLSELGLHPDTNFTTLKQTDPNAYNKVLSYVKSKVYQSPAYGALSEGQNRTEFATGQLGEYSKNPYQHIQEQQPALETKFNLPTLENSYQDLSAGAAAAPSQIRERVVKEGGYDIPKLTDTYAAAQNEYLDAYTKFSRGEIDNGAMAAARSKLSSAQRSLDSAKTGLETETEKGLGQYNQNMNLSKDRFDSAYKRYSEALDLESKGYAQGREEKQKAAEDMYSFAKELLDNSKQDQDKYQSAMGKIWNPNTGKYESKPRAGGGTPTTDKVFAAGDKLRADLAKGTLDWGQAFNRIKAQYPDAPNEKIDAALGGSGGYNQGTGTFDPSKATGFAQPGPRGDVTKTDTRTKAYGELNADISNIPEGTDPNEAYSLLLEAYGNDLNDSEIKAALAAKGIYL